MDEQPPETRILYAFFADSLMMKWIEEDVVLEFFHFPPDSDGKMPSVRIRCSPKRFKAFVKAMTNTLKDYEKKHGEIDTKNIVVHSKQIES